MRMTVSREHTPSARGVGNLVSPRPRPREGLALKQGDGETRFPHTPARRRVCGAQPCAMGIEKLIRYIGLAVGLMVFEKFIRYAGLAVGLMVFEKFIRYTGLAVGLKPSARGCEGRLRGRERIIFSKTISPRLGDAKAACAGESGVISQRPSALG